MLVELSGEQPDLARAETLAALEVGGGAKVLLAESRLLALETEADPAWLGRRLALAHYVDELIAWGSLEEVLPVAGTLDFGDRTFRVRVNSLKGCHNKVELEKRIGDVVTGPVDMRDPDEEVRLIEGETHFLCRRLAAIDRRAFETRKVAHRPFFSPISLHPRLARALVNLARVPEGGSLLDPFCGTGGVLLEAGLVGAQIVGSDLREDMVDGSRAMLKEWGLEASLQAMDVGEVPARLGPVDAIATDPPYARSTSTGGEPLPSLYRRALEAAAEVLRPRGHLAIIVPQPELAKPPNELRQIGTYPLRVHRSLTRNFVVMRREDGR